MVHNTSNFFEAILYLSYRVTTAITQITLVNCVMCFGAISDREIRDSSPPLTAVSGPAEGALHSSQSHTKRILLYSSLILGQPKESDHISYFSLFVTFLVAERTNWAHNLRNSAVYCVTWS